MPIAKASYAEAQHEAHHAHPHLRVINGGRNQAPKGELRKSRRIPVQCKVEIKAQDGWEIHYGMSSNISVDGICFITDYVPRFGQLLEVHVVPPEGSAIRPLRALIQVKRCHQVVAGKQYEIGAVILKIRG